MDWEDNRAQEMKDMLANGYAAPSHTVPSHTSTDKQVTMHAMVVAGYVQRGSHHGQ